MGNLYHLILLFVQLYPKHVLQLADTQSADGRNVYHGNPQFLGELRVARCALRVRGIFQEVALADGEDTRFGEQFGVVFLQFVEQDMVLRCDVFRRGRHHEQQDGIALDMSQEAQSEPLAFGSALNDSRDVCHAERLPIAIGDNAQLGGEGGEGIVGYLGFGSRDHAQQGGLSGIGESYESHIRQHFQLQNHIALLRGLSGLCIARCLVGGGAEMPVAQSASPAFEQHHALVVVAYLADELPCVAIIDHGAAGHLDDAVFAVFAEGAAVAALAAVGRHDMLLVFQVEQRPEVAVASEDNAAALAAIAAVRTALGQVFGAVEVHTACAALSRTAVNLYIVYEVRRRHVLDNYEL